MIEHPDTVADRIVRYAEIVWAKLDALAEGARRASERLWG
jgi:hypothetical protein